MKCHKLFEKYHLCGNQSGWSRRSAIAFDRPQPTSGDQNMVKTANQPIFAEKAFFPLCIPGFSPFIAHLTRYYTLPYNLWFQQCVNQHSACMGEAFLPKYISLAVLHSLCHLHHLRNQRVWVLILRYSRDIHFVTIIPIQIDTKCFSKTAVYLLCYNLICAKNKRIQSNRVTRTNICDCYTGT